jgi:hypothetical protein
VAAIASDDGLRNAGVALVQVPQNVRCTTTLATAASCVHRFAYSITSSARASNECGIVTPRAFAAGPFLLHSGEARRNKKKGSTEAEASQRQWTKPWSSGLIKTMTTSA